MKTPEQIAEQMVRQYISAPLAAEQMTPRQLIAGLGLSNIQAASIFDMIADAIEADRAQRAAGEPDEPIPADPRFPDRPTHPDFARLSAAAIEMDRRSDESDDSVTPPEMIGIDGDTLAYMASQRIGLAYEHPLVQLMPRNIQLQGAWADGFAVGVEYQKRGGSRKVAE